MVLKGQYIRAIYNNKKYFTLGGCTGLGRPIHTYEQREQATITDLKYFPLAGRAGLGRLFNRY